MDNEIKTWEDISNLPTALDKDIYSRAAQMVVVTRFASKKESLSNNDYVQLYKNMPALEKELIKMEAVVKILGTKEFKAYYDLVNKEEIKGSQLLDKINGEEAQRGVDQEIAQSRTRIKVRMNMDSITSDSDLDNEILAAEFYQTILDNENTG